eukprot:scaffold9.g3227.t1
MAPKRGMSLEDKRQTVLQVFHETKARHRARAIPATRTDVFLLKDIEKLASKRGVVTQSVKEVVQSLVDDDLVKQEKIGVSNYFWSFPSDHAVKLSSERTRLEGKLQALKDERQKLEGQLEQARAGKEDTEERRELAAELAGLEAEVAAQRAELAGYSENDPERYESLKKSTQIALDAANRWVDNIFCLQSWLKKQFEGSEAAVANMFKEASWAGGPGREPVAFPSQEPPSSRPYQPYAAEERTVVGLHIPGASSLYLILGLLQLAAAVVALIAPYWLTDRFFRGSPAHVVIFEELWRILAACLIAGACVCYALKAREAVAADRRQLNDYAVQRLQGLVKSLSWTGLLLGALVMAPTLLIPSVHLGLSGGFNVQPMMESPAPPPRPAAHQAPPPAGGLTAEQRRGPDPYHMQGLSACLSNLFSPARFTAAVFLYALLTVLFTAAGLLYVIVPRVSMGWVFGTHGTNAAAFIWQWIGAALFFLFPAITYTCQARAAAGAAAAPSPRSPACPLRAPRLRGCARRLRGRTPEHALVGRLATTIPKTLNVGLLVAALFHILELGSLLVDGGIKSRWLLPVLFAHWLLVLLASVIGLSASEPAPAFGTSETPFGQPAAPVLIFYNGFQLRASFYTQLAEHAASWGVAVLQYDTGFGSTPTIAAEVALAPALAAWIAAAAVEPGGPYSGRLDPNRLAVGGHSRGGKLAALVLAGYPETFKAAYLVDPVDVTKYAPESAKNPSATRALANHSRFADGGAIINVAADLLCGRGNDSREEVAELTATPLVAWLYQQLPPAGGSNSGISSSNDSAGTVAAASAAPAASAGAQGSPLAAQFWTWVAQQEVAGKMAFEVKAAPSNGALAPALEPALALAAGAW